jgi:hypothetical protein
MDFPMDFWLFGFVSSKYIYKKLTKKRATSKIWTKVKKVNKPPPQKEENHRLDLKSIS